jgi:hypothetical protein
MKHRVFATLLTVGLSAPLVAQEPVTVAATRDDKVSVVGCVIKGDGGYVLANLEDSWVSSPAGSRAATVTSASNVAGRTFYWLTDDDDLEKYSGQRVEVGGKLDNEIDKGKISVEREDGMIKIEFDAEGERKVKVKVPEVPTMVGTSGTVSDREKTYRVAIRKIDVQSVKVLASTCQ